MIRCRSLGAAVKTDMFSIFSKKDDDQKNPKEGGSLLDRLKQSISKTRTQIATKVEDLISGEKKIDPDLLTKLENALLAADLGPRTTHQILEAVRQKLERHALASAADLKTELKNQLLYVLRTVPSPKGKSDGASNGTAAAAQEPRPRVIFVVGVNGTGKTTTIGKLAHRLRQDGKNVVLAAGDTFRAAAIEQLAVWAARTGSEIVKTKSGGDPAAVVYDALSSARVPQRRRRHRGHRGTPAHEIEPDGRTRQNETHGRKSNSRRATRSSPRDGRDDRPERAIPGARIYRDGGRYRHRADEARRHG